jgi:hypothetical protein
MMIKRGKAILGVWRGTPPTSPLSMASPPAGHWYGLSAYPWSKVPFFSVESIKTAARNEHYGTPPFAHLGTLVPGPQQIYSIPQVPIPISIGKCPPGMQYVWDPSINSYTCGFAGQTS